MRPSWGRARARARDWLAADAHLWTLVIRPWLLVQEMAGRPTRS
ncbi:MAG: DUF2288 family protein [Gammaproteobacteria bacterium]|nr:MAG: DUF2288 family protein [Gammaproteobacteria bacterium]